MGISFMFRSFLTKWIFFTLLIAAYALYKKPYRKPGAKKYNCSECGVEMEVSTLRCQNCAGTFQRGNI
jgi:hypothetical protein